MKTVDDDGPRNGHSGEPARLLIREAAGHAGLLQRAEGPAETFTEDGLAEDRVIVGVDR